MVLIKKVVKNEKFNSIDLFKSIMAFLVIANHTLGIVENENSFVWTILKCAVLFYFMALGFLQQIR